MRNLALTAITMLVLAGAARADLIANGGFEDGFNGWNPSPVGSSTYQVFADSFRHSGDSALAFFGSSPIDSVFQSVATTTGATYKVDFWLRTAGTNPPSSSSLFRAVWDGAEIMSTSGTLFGYTEYTFYLLATTSSTEIRFEGYNAPNAYYLDDISVTVVPVPAGLFLGIGGLAAVGGLSTIRRRQGRD